MGRIGLEQLSLARSKTANSASDSAKSGAHNASNIPLDNKQLTKTQKPGLAILLQKYPDLQQIILAWPRPTEHIKAAIKALTESYRDDTEQR